MSRSFIACLIAVGSFAGSLPLLSCSRHTESPRVPLGAAAAGSPAADPMAGAARQALDSGNAAFRARQFGAALHQYRLAAAAAPDNVAPYFGEYMVAQKTANRALADSAMREVRRLSSTQSSMLTDSAMQTLHAKGHPAVK